MEKEDKEKLEKYIRRQKIKEPIIYLAGLIAIIAFAILVTGCGEKVPANKKTGRPAIAASWYEGDQMIPTVELGEDPDWGIVVRGKTTDQGFDDSMDIDRNLVDTTANGVGHGIVAKFYQSTDPEHGNVITEFPSYLNAPVTVEPGMTYKIELNCGVMSNTIAPVSLDTMRYYISPLRMQAGEASAITIAFYDEEARVFRQYCVPFCTREDIEIDYQIDEEYEEWMDGQAYILYFWPERPNETEE